jgi:hypothetical protein
MEWVQKNKDGIGTVCLEWRGELERYIACAPSNTCCPGVLSICCYVDTYCPSATHIFLLIFLFCPSLTTVAVISVLFILTIFILILRSDVVFAIILIIVALIIRASTVIFFFLSSSSKFDSSSLCRRTAILRVIVLCEGYIDTPRWNYRRHKSGCNNQHCHYCKTFASHYHLN